MQLSAWKHFFSFSLQCCLLLHLVCSSKSIIFFPAAKWSQVSRPDDREPTKDTSMTSLAQISLILKIVTVNVLESKFNTPLRISLKFFWKFFYLSVCSGLIRINLRKKSMYRKKITTKATFSVSFSITNFLLFKLFSQIYLRAGKASFW